MFTIYNLSSLCMLTANGFFFGQVCLRLALEVQYHVDRFGIHQTTVSRTFNFLWHQFFHWFWQRLDSLSTFCFDHFVPRLHNRTLQLFLFVLVLSHVIHLYILWWANIYILTFFQILCNCVLVKFISLAAWVLTYSRLVGNHFNQHTHTRARAHTRPYALKCFQTYIWTIALILCR